MILRDLLHLLEQRLASSCGASARDELMWLAQEVFGCSRAQLFMQLDNAVPQELKTKLESFVSKRINDHMPLQYILGHVPFMDHSFLVRPPTLIPRPETEEMVAWLLQQITAAQVHDLRILDMCAGSGCIGLSLAAQLPESFVDCVDKASTACQLMAENQQRLGVTNVEIIQSDLFEKLTHRRYDIIISNPPYLTPDEYQALPPDVWQWEDEAALVDYDNGVGIYKKIIAAAPTHLTMRYKQIPAIVFELGLHVDSIRNLLLSAHYKNVQIMRDLQQKERWISALI